MRSFRSGIAKWEMNGGTRRQWACSQIECVDVGSKRRSEKAMGEIKRAKRAERYVRGKFERMSSRVNLNRGSRCLLCVSRRAASWLSRFTPAIQKWLVNTKRRVVSLKIKTYWCEISFLWYYNIFSITVVCSIEKQL